MLLAVGKNTRRVIERQTLEDLDSMAPEEWVMSILEAGGIILTPMANHHMLHLPACLPEDVKRNA